MNDVRLKYYDEIYDDEFILSFLKKGHNVDNDIICYLASNPSKTHVFSFNDPTIVEVLYFVFIEIKYPLKRNIYFGFVSNE